MPSRRQYLFPFSPQSPFGVGVSGSGGGVLASAGACSFYEETQWLRSFSFDNLLLFDIHFTTRSRNINGRKSTGFRGKETIQFSDFLEQPPQQNTKISGEHNATTITIHSNSKKLESDCGDRNQYDIGYDQKYEKENNDIWHGVILHLMNVFVSMTVIIAFSVWFSTSSCLHHCTEVVINPNSAEMEEERTELDLSSTAKASSSSSSFCFMIAAGFLCACFSQIGLIVDNAVNAMGKFLGEGDILRWLTKSRIIFHVSGLPLLAIPVSLIGMERGLMSFSTYRILTNVILVWTLYEVFCWSKYYDIRNLILVDLRNSHKHRGNYLAGTLAYTSGKVVELVLPAVLLIFYEIILGYILVFRMGDTHPSGKILLLSGTMTLLSCAVPKRPDIQLFGENLHGAGIFVALSTLITHN